MTTNNFGISEQSKEILLEILRSYPRITRAVIFGSRAKGNYNTGSDIDIAVYGADAETAMNLSAELNEKTSSPYFFDVIAVEGLINPELLEHINRIGKEIYEKEK
jgi:predicted nucleotidyltransferase